MEHMHEHEHTHTHSHPHTHDGDHCHGHIHSCPEGTGGTRQTKVLLEYMIHHNGQHADELAKLGDELPEEVREKLMAAVNTFQNANEQLKAVLGELE